MGDVTHLIEAYFYESASLFRFPTFLPNWVIDKISHFMKVIGNEGHHHLIFDIDLHMNFTICTK